MANTYTKASNKSIRKNSQSQRSSARTSETEAQPDRPVPSSRIAD